MSFLDTKGTGSFWAPPQTYEERTLTAIRFILLETHQHSCHSAVNKAEHLPDLVQSSIPGGLTIVKVHKCLVMLPPGCRTGLTSWRNKPTLSSRCDEGLLIVRNQLRAFAVVASVNSIVDNPQIAQKCSEGNTALPLSEFCCL